MLTGKSALRYSGQMDTTTEVKGGFLKSLFQRKPKEAIQAPPQEQPKPTEKAEVKDATKEADAALAKMKKNLFARSVSRLAAPGAYALMGIAAAGMPTMGIGSALAGLALGGWYYIRRQGFEKRGKETEEKLHDTQEPEVAKQIIKQYGGL